MRWYATRERGAVPRRGFAMGEHHDAALAKAALCMAAAVRGGDVASVVFHSDKGGQYVGDLFARACHGLGVTQSMGRVGSALDNAAAESGNSTLEHELLSAVGSPPGPGAPRGRPVHRRLQPPPPAQHLRDGPPVAMSSYSLTEPPRRPKRAEPRETGLSDRLEAAKATQMPSRCRRMRGSISYQQTAPFRGKPTTRPRSPRRTGVVATRTARTGAPNLGGSGRVVRRGSPARIPPRPPRRRQTTLARGSRRPRRHPSACRNPSTAERSAVADTSLRLRRRTLENERDRSTTAAGSVSSYGVDQAVVTAIVEDPSEPRKGVFRASGHKGVLRSGGSDVCAINAERCVAAAMSSR
jgi:hypothetical protein